jgi:amino-acid N-acetyltransferase
MRIRRARPAEAAAIHSLIAPYVAQGLLLPRTPDQIQHGIGNFLVALDGGHVRGCVALESYGDALAEIRSLAVAPDARGSGIGGKLLEAAMKRARRRKIGRLLAVTRAGQFFERHGFARLRGGMPAEKIARDCSQCPKAADCRLEALALDLAPARAVLPVLQPARLPRAPRPLPA